MSAFLAAAVSAALVTAASAAQSSDLGGPDLRGPDLGGRWIIEWRDAGMSNGDVSYIRTVVEHQGERLSMRSPRMWLEGTMRGTQVELREPHWAEGERVYRGTLKDGRFHLLARTPLADYELTVYRDEPRHTSPRVHRFEPKVFHRLFRGDVEPALRINPGDTVSTWTLDATGKDANDVARSAGGNPQTGPFHVDGALPGDTLVVHLRLIRLNRDTAVTTAQLMPSVLNVFYHSNLPPTEFGLAFWQLDRTAGVARLKGRAFAETP